MTFGKLSKGYQRHKRIKIVVAIDGFMAHHIKQILQVIILMTVMMVSSLHETVLENTTNCSVTFYLVHTTVPNYN